MLSVAVVLFVTRVVLVSLLYWVCEWCIAVNCYACHCLSICLFGCLRFLFNLFVMFSCVMVSQCLFSSLLFVVCLCDYVLVVSLLLASVCLLWLVLMCYCFSSCVFCVFQCFWPVFVFVWLFSVSVS